MVCSAGFCWISVRGFNGAWAKIPLSSDGEQKDSLPHPISKETLWKHFIRELQLDRIMEETRQLSLLLNLRVTESLWYARNRLRAPRCYLRTQLLLPVRMQAVKDVLTLLPGVLADAVGTAARVVPAVSWRV